MVWGDADDSITTGIASAVWYAHFDGTSWGVPEKIADRSSTLWTPTTTSPLLRLTSGDLVVISKTGHISRELAVFRRSGSWRRTVVSTQPIMGPGYLGLVETAPGVLTVAGVSAYAPPGETDLGSVFVARSEDAGRNWSPFHQIHRSGSRPAHLVRLVATSGTGHELRGEVFLTWHTPGARADSLHVLTSRDGGLTWVAVPSLALPPATFGHDIAVRCDGRVEVAASVRSSVADRLMVLSAYTWDRRHVGSRGWSTVQSRTPLINRVPRFLTSSRSTPKLLLGTVRISRTRDPYPVNIYALRVGDRPACEVRVAATAQGRRASDTRRESRREYALR